MPSAGQSFTAELFEAYKFRRENRASEPEPTMSDLAQTLRQELVRRLKVRSTIEADTPLFSGGLLDSLSVLELVTLVEELAGNPVPPEAITLENFDTLTLITSFATRLKNGGV